ncbi:MULTISPECIES: 6-carboxytetrahydropterin synthase QueD [Geomicrobium]|uniref:6-carboxy-5,6,7,8-tetrahydropterin synthase n=1 Tax=Geomicrobium sediminis TaxID=1347788 RepID=A0ABS2P9Q4_9BACL|nr:MULTISPECIES: 6-carboxytetrahydropterin synthase QueD [Geomicrobium]MBM7632134.1 6-pyruvoyltetrahydropterin/6-carboxytetrahydropterin synthase [Geomicrobium sediminis]GAK08860.1 queuosine biosynthesis QueD, PTPS-I [Geomicrobium sp. JCM 19038]
MLQQFYPQVHHDYRYELNKDMHFAAAHFIDDERAGVCKEMHGHTYFVNITVAGDDLDDTGFLINFKSLKKQVHGRFDHTLLNTHPEFPEGIPTTEVVAKVIWELVDELLSQEKHRPYCLQVIVRETPTSYAIYRPKRGEHR